MKSKVQDTQFRMLTAIILPYLFHSTCGFQACCFRGLANSMSGEWHRLTQYVTCIFFPTESELLIVSYFRGLQTNSMFPQVSFISFHFQKINKPFLNKIGGFLPLFIMHIKSPQCLLAFGHINTYPRKKDRLPSQFTLWESIHKQITVIHLSQEYCLFLSVHHYVNFYTITSIILTANCGSLRRMALLFLQVEMKRQGPSQECKSKRGGCGSRTQDPDRLALYDVHYM